MSDARTIAFCESEACYRAQTERIRILADFVGRSIFAINADDGIDEDLVAADNLARIAALRAIRRAADWS